MASADILNLPGMGNAMSFYDHKPAMVDSTKTNTEHVECSPTTFDAERHIEFEPPAKIIKMSDISLPSDIGISPVALSEPFRLFSKEAVMAMRKEIMSDKVMKNYSHNSDVACTQLRGYAQQSVVPSSPS